MITREAFHDHGRQEVISRIFPARDHWKCTPAGYDGGDPDLTFSARTRAADWRFRYRNFTGGPSCKRSDLMP
jgi:hypothetical protein